MSRVYKAAVIGAGTGGKLSMQALTTSHRFDLVAVADISRGARQAAAAQYPDLAIYPSYQELFASEAIDVASVSTWAPSHLDVTRAALGCPLTGLLVEKPLADNTADGSTLLELVRKKRLPLAVPHGLLVAPHVQEILSRVQRGEIGDLRLVEIQCSEWDIINAGIHWLNFFVVLTHGDPVESVLAACDARSRTYRDGMQVETSAVTYAQTRSGVRVVMNTGDYVAISEPDVSTLFRLVGTKGTIDFYAWESRYRILNATHPQGAVIKPNPGTRTRHQIHLENLAEQMDRNVPDYRVAESSLMALELCEAAYLSHRARCQVSVPLAGFAPPMPTGWDPGTPYGGSGGGQDGRKLPIH